MSEAEYKAVRAEGAGLIDLSSRARIKVGGSEAVMFLNGLITNDMKTLEVDRWMAAVFPNVQGRLIASVRVIRLRDEPNTAKASLTFFIDTEAETHQAVLKTVERFTMAGDFRVSDVTDATSMLSVQGKNAAEVIDRALGSALSEVSGNGVVETVWNGTELIVIHASHTSEDGFDLIISSEHRPMLVEVLIDAGATPVTDETFDILRLEAGIGVFGRDMDGTNVVTEANLDDAVSFTKGCYIGQEIIARIKYRGHVAKKLSGLMFSSEDKVEVGSIIKSNDKDIGRVTSVTVSPTLQKTIALAYLRYEFLSPGTNVVVLTNGREVEATVHELPFVRGSWYSKN